MLERLWQGNNRKDTKGNDCVVVVVGCCGCDGGIFLIARGTYLLIQTVTVSIEMIEFGVNGRCSTAQQCRTAPSSSRGVFCSGVKSPNHQSDVGGMERPCM
jgi:hypothetical protein